MPSKKLTLVEIYLSERIKCKFESLSNDFLHFIICQGMNEYMHIILVNGMSIYTYILQRVMSAIRDQSVYTAAACKRTMYTFGTSV